MTCHAALNTDWTAVLAAQGSTSTATFPYFARVTGQTGMGHGGGGGAADGPIFTGKLGGAGAPPSPTLTTGVASR